MPRPARAKWVDLRHKAWAVLAMGVEKELKYKYSTRVPPGPGYSQAGDYGNELSAGGISVSR